VAVVAALRRFSGTPEEFPRYVWGIASHKVSDALRRLGRDRSTPVDVVPEVSDPGEAPEVRAVRAEQTRSLVGWARDQVTVHEWRVLIHRVFHDLSAEEAAEAIGTSPTAVRVAQHRALTKLRRRIDRSPHG
jgi:RNA polymerase sigma-70 factor, ECF subfamily